MIRFRFSGVAIRTHPLAAPLLMSLICRLFGLAIATTTASIKATVQEMRMAA